MTDSIENDNPFDCRYDRLELPRERRESIGRKVKRILDVARATYVTKNLGMKTELFFYCTPEISPENVVLLATSDKTT